MKNTPHGGGKTGNSVKPSQSRNPSKGSTGMAAKSREKQKHSFKP